MTRAVELLFQQGISPAEAGVPQPSLRVSVDHGMRIERDRGVVLGDGTVIYVDVFRPDQRDDVPILIAWGPYGKHNGGAVYQQFRNEAGERGGGVRPEWISEYTTFEGPDPRTWCSFGYAVVNVDPRATWWSGGDYATFWDEREARDCADVIAWAGSQPWSNGRVGMSGVSYLAVSQWWAASLRPPALAAINPCEGVSDVYREFAFHGGIPSGFPDFWQHHRLQYSRAKVEAMADMMVGHPLDDDYWKTKRPDLARIDVPAFVIASWSDQGLHTRGTLAAFAQISSAHKYLEVHGRKKWEYYHQPPTVARQRMFFDRFLRDVDNGVDEWPTVRFETRISSYSGAERTLPAWPPAGTGFRRLYLDARDATLGNTRPTAAGTASYLAEEGAEEIHFDHVFGADTDIIGGMGLHLWVEADGADDMDLFVAVTKLDRDGAPVDFPFANVLDRGPVALGWLRVSHRLLDPERTTMDRPWHPHTREDLLRPGEVVDVDVEIWPSATRFLAGERLRLILRGGDLISAAVMSRHGTTRNRGRHVVHTGSAHEAFLTVPTASPPGGAEPDFAP